MNTEHAAGGIVVKKTAGDWLVLLIRDKDKMLTFPKGIIEEDENEKEAAKREVAEETGVQGLTYMCPLATIAYDLVRNGVVTHKTVDYFLFFLAQDVPLVGQKEEGISEVLWMKLSDAIANVGYPDTNCGVLLAAGQYLSTHATI